MSGSIVSEQVKNEEYLNRIVDQVFGNKAIVHRYDSTSYSVYLPPYYTPWDEIEILERFVKIKGISNIDDFPKDHESRTRLTVEFKEKRS